MIFYVVGESNGEVLSCFTSFAQAHGLAESHCTKWGVDTYVNKIQVPVTTESIRLMLGELGGYATSQERMTQFSIWEPEND